MKKMTKQQLLHSQNAASHVSTSIKKKSKTSSTSFTPYNKSATQSTDMQLQMGARYSSGTNETPLAMNQNVEYFANSQGGTTLGPSGNSQVSHLHHQPVSRVIMHKPSNSQLVPNLTGSIEAGSGHNLHHTGLGGGAQVASATKTTTKISTLKNKAAFEKFHPSQQLPLNNGSEYSPDQAISKPASVMHSSQMNTAPQSLSGTQSNTAVISKLSHYQKMTSGPQKRTYVRNSSKKAAQGSLDGGPNIVSTHHLNPKLIANHQMDEKVKKSSSQSLIKMQVAQMVSSHGYGKDGTQITHKSSFKTPGNSIAKKTVIDPSATSGLTSSKADSASTKKLIFSFKKDSKQKVTPPNASGGVNGSQPGVKPSAIVGHHRRVQSHGNAAVTAQTALLKTEPQKSNKVHSPKVERASSSEIIAEALPGQAATEAASSSRGANVIQAAPTQTITGHHPALSKHYKDHALNKSKTSPGVSQTSLNGSRDQVSILSLNSFSRSTPKFTQVLSLPQSVLNYQATMSRATNLPANMLSPQSLTQVKTSLNSQITPAKPIGVHKEKKQASGGTSGQAPNDGGMTQTANTGGSASMKKSGKVLKSNKLRVKQAASTTNAQGKNEGAHNIGTINSMGARQASPEMKAESTNKVEQVMFSASSTLHKTQNPTRFELRQISGRNIETKTKSTGEIKEKSNSNQIKSGSRKLEKHDSNHTPKDHDMIMEAIGEEFPLVKETNELPNSQISYKMYNGQPGHHQKSQSFGGTLNTPGIYNMYMGQVKQLKKQRSSLQKNQIGSNSQPTHFINLNVDPSPSAAINQHASHESLQKNSSLVQTSAKLKMSQTRKAPHKLHLTMPPSAHHEKSQPDLQNPLHDSLSQDHDIPGNDLSQQPKANQVPPSLSTQIVSGHTSLPMQVMRPSRQLVESQNPNTMSSAASSQAKIINPSATGNQNATVSQYQSQSQSIKNLALRHKQLAKAIKQHHNINVARQSETAPTLGPMYSKTLSSSNHLMGKIAPDVDNFMDEKHQIRSTLSPKHLQRKNACKTMSPAQVISPQNAANSSLSTKNLQGIKHPQNTNLNQGLSGTANDAFKSERKLPTGSRQKCWGSPGGMTSSDDGENDTVRQADYLTSNAGITTNIMHQDTGGQKSQQISAAIIKKIQNNYQVQVTNAAAYDSTHTTASQDALNKITAKLKSDNNSVLPYLQALSEISQVYPSNYGLTTALSQIHQGISTLMLIKEDQIQKSNKQHSNTSKIIHEKEEELKVAYDQIQHLERNESETRRSVQRMTEQIDERDYKIEQLETKILEHQKRARLMFKKQMESRTERPKLDLVFDGNCSELERQSDERRRVFQENEELQAAIDELNEDMAYGKQRENKLMFFLYILKQMGYPISEVFEREIKDVPTSRFSKNFDDEYKVMHAQLWKERKEAKKEAKLVAQNGFGIDRDDILIESLPKSDRLVPQVTNHNFSNARRHSLGPAVTNTNFDDDDDLNFYPLQIGPILQPTKPQSVPPLNIDKVLIIKHRRAKGLQVSNLINKTDSLDHQSQSSEESLDSRGRPKRCPRPRLHKKILDQYGITTGARNILALESKIFKQKYMDYMRTHGTPEGVNSDEDELRYSLNSQRAESMQSQRI